MCTGLEIAGMIGSMALSTAGAMYNKNIQQSYVDETNRQNKISMDREAKARAEEVSRQRDWENQQFTDVQTAAGRSDPAAIADVVAANAADPSNEFVSQADDYNIAHLQGQDTSGEIANNIGQTVGDALARTKEILRAKSVLSGQDDAFAGMRDAALRMRDQVSNVGSNRNRSAGVAQMETTIPNARVTPSDSPLGDILMLAGKLVGGVGGLGGIGGIGGAGAATAATTIPQMMVQNSAFTPSFG